MKLDVNAVPRWAWYASGGVVALTVGYRVLQSRRATELEAVDTTEPSSYAETDPSAQRYLPTNTVPVFMGGDDSGSSESGLSFVGDAIGGAFELARGALDSATSTTSTVTDWSTNFFTEQAAQSAGVLQSQQEYSLRIAELMAAGQAPAPVQQTPVIGAAPTPTAPPVSVNPAPGRRAAPNGFPEWNAARQLYFRREVAKKDGTAAQSGHKYKKGDELHVYENGLVIRDASPGKK